MRKPENSSDYLTYFGITKATMEGTPLVRPLFYQFPLDDKTYDISKQFMIGDAIMVSPVMIQSADSNSATDTVYFPKGTWYDYYTGQMVVDNPSHGTDIVLMTPISHLNIYVKGAAAFATQVYFLEIHWFKLIQDSSNSFE